MDIERKKFMSRIVSMTLAVIMIATSVLTAPGLGSRAEASGTDEGAVQIQAGADEIVSDTEGLPEIQEELDIRQQNAVRAGVSDLGSFDGYTLLPQAPMKASAQTDNYEDKTTAYNEGGAALAFDGDLGTAWHTAYSGNTESYVSNKDTNHWIQWNLGDTYQIGKIAYTRKGNNGRWTRVKVEVTLDGGTTWTTVVENQSVVDAAATQYIDINPAVNASGIKVTVLESANSEANHYYASAGEINVYRKADPSELPVYPGYEVLSQEPMKDSATASNSHVSGENDTDGGAGMAFDGNNATGWHTSWGGDYTSTETAHHWVEWDLGGAYTVGKIAYTNKATGSNGIWKKVKVETCFNGVWTTVVEAKDFPQPANLGAVTTQVIDFADITASKVRVTVLESYNDDAGGKKFAGAGEINVYKKILDSTALPAFEGFELLPQGPMKSSAVASNANSPSGTDGGPDLAFDGNNGTGWHTSWGGDYSSTETAHHYIEWELGGTYTIAKLAYANKNTGSNGLWKKIKIETYNKDTWSTAIEEYNFAEPADYGKVTLQLIDVTPVKASKVRVTVLDSYNRQANSKFAAAGDINVYRSLEEIFALKIKVNGVAASGDSLEEAFTASGIQKDAVTSLEFVSGEVTQADFGWLKKVPGADSIMDTMTSFIIDTGVKVEEKRIPAGTGIGCGVLKTLELNGVEVLDTAAFANAVALETIELPDVVEIGHNALGLSQPSLTSVTMPNVEKIGNMAFYGQSKLTSVEMPKVKSIGDNAFKKCSGILEYNVPNLENIGDMAFAGSGAFVMTVGKIPAVKAGTHPFGDDTEVQSGTGYNRNAVMMIPETLIEEMLAHGGRPNEENKDKFYSLKFRCEGYNVTRFQLSIMSEQYVFVKNGEAYGSKLPTAPAISGSIFTGWNTGSDGKGTAVNAETVTGSAENITSSLSVYAIYRREASYKVTFDVDGTETEVTVKETDNVLGSRLPASPSKANYTFTGWNTKQDGTGTKVDAATAVTSDLKVYSVFTENTYKVVFDTDGKTTEVSIGAAHNTIGSKLPANPSKTGYTFEGWNTAKDGKGMAVTASTTVTADMTVYAVFKEITYKVTFHVEGKTTEVTIGASNNVIGNRLPAAPVKTNYTFTGWNTKQDGTGTKVDAATAVTSELNVYAMFTENTYKVVFDVDGKTTDVLIGAAHNTIGSKLPANPSKAGYTFAGWNTSKDGKGTVVTGATTVTANITVYAVFKEITYKVTFYVDGKTSEVTIGASNNVLGSRLPADPVKAGYRFEGWNTALNGTGTKVNAATTVTKDLNVYAVFKEIVYKVTFDVDGKTSVIEVKGVSNTIGSQMPADPAKTGYRFLGWNTKKDGSGTKVDAAAKVTSDMTVYAIFEIIVKDVVISNIKIKGVTDGTKVYDGKSAPLYGTPDFGNSGYDGRDLVVIYKDGNGKVMQSAPLNAGSYTMELQIPESNIRFRGSASVSFTILKKDVIITGKELRVSIADLDGVDYEYRTEGLVYGEKLITEPVFKVNGVVSKTESGTYETVGTGAKASDNYTLSYQTGKLITYVPEYKITYQLNQGGVAYDAPEKYMYLKGATLPIPLRDGHIFKGWFEPNSTRQITAIGPAEKGDKVFIASWSKKPSGIKVTKTAVSGLSVMVAFEADSPYKGFDVKYSTSSKFYNAASSKVEVVNGEGTLSFNINLTGLKAEKNYYVKVRGYDTDYRGRKVYGSYGDAQTFRIKLPVYKIKYDLNGGRNQWRAPVKYTYTKRTVLPVPTRKGYVFKGWFEKGGKTQVRVIGAAQKGNKVYTAKWARIPSGISIKEVVSDKKYGLKVTYSSSIACDGFLVKSSTRKGFGASVSKRNLIKNSRPRKSHTASLIRLEKNTGYYIKVRGYVTDYAGEKVYGPYGKVVYTVTMK